MVQRQWLYLTMFDGMRCRSCDVSAMWPDRRNNPHVAPVIPLRTHASPARARPPHRALGDPGLFPFSYPVFSDCRPTREQQYVQARL
jgi:hypothetical protein